MNSVPALDLVLTNALCKSIDNQENKEAKMKKFFEILSGNQIDITNYYSSLNIKEDPSCFLIKTPKNEFSLKGVTW